MDFTTEGHIPPYLAAHMKQYAHRISFASSNGGNRYQDDRFVVRPINVKGPHGTGILLAVADGHGSLLESHATSEAICEQLPLLFKKNILAYENPRQTILKTYDDLYEATKGHRETGSTLTLAYVTGNEAYAGILGDSPLVHVRKTPLGIKRFDLHDANNKPEKERCIREGAEYHGGMFGNGKGSRIAVTRSLGDSKFGFLGRTPDSHTISLGEGDVLLLGSDGLDTLPNSAVPQALQAFTEKKEPEVAKKLVDQPAWDNVTAIFYRHVRV